jgi:hypothetical protein
VDEPQAQAARLAGDLELAGGHQARQAAGAGQGHPLRLSVAAAGMQHRQRHTRLAQRCQ